MAREKELFRDNLVRLDAAFPNKDLIPIKEAAQYIGCDYRTLLGSRGFPSRKVGRFWYAPKVQLASWLS